MRAVALLALLVVGLSLAGSGAATVSPPRIPLVVDTDLSSDDVIALAALANDPRVQLEAVTVSGTGLVHCPAGRTLAVELLSALRQRDVPVACGRSLPLQLVHILPADWRAAADGLFGVELPPATAAAPRSAVALLREAITAAPTPPTLLELAPMTNLADLLRTYPALTRKIHRIVAMAGAFSVPGNAPGDAAAETNVWLDPAAARIVVRSHAPVTLVPLDATNAVPVTASVTEPLKRYHVGERAATIAWDLVLASAMDRGGQYFWDPLAALAVSRPSLLRTETRSVDVATGHANAGRTFFSATGANVAVATGASRAAFERALIGTLLHGRPYTVSAQHVNALITYTGTGCTYRGTRSVIAGPFTVDTENRSSRSFTWVAGRLDPRHSFAELARYVLDPRHAGSSPSWFTFDASGETPPRSSMTWRSYLQSGATGTTIVACGTAAPPRAWLLARVAVFAGSR